MRKKIEGLSLNKKGIKFEAGLNELAIANSIKRLKNKQVDRSASLGVQHGKVTDSTKLMLRYLDMVENKKDKHEEQKD